MTFPRIALDPAVMGGKPCIRGTRVTVGALVGQIGAGASIADLLRVDPYLAEADIREAVDFSRSGRSRVLPLRDRGAGRN